MAEAIAVLARPVAQVQAHGGAAVLDAQRGEAARPRVHRALEREVQIQLALHIACRQARNKLQGPIKWKCQCFAGRMSRNSSIAQSAFPANHVVTWGVALS